MIVMTGQHSRYQYFAFHTFLPFFTAEKEYRILEKTTGFSPWLFSIRELYHSP
jgi:hypothetical protein